MLGSFWPNCTVAVAGVTTTEIAFTVTVIDICAGGSATEVAVTVTIKSPNEGGVGGAV